MIFLFRFSPIFPTKSLAETGTLLHERINLLFELSGFCSTKTNLLSDLEMDSKNSLKSLLSIRFLENIALKFKAKFLASNRKFYYNFLHFEVLSQAPQMKNRWNLDIWNHLSISYRLQLFHRSFLATIFKIFIEFKFTVWMSFWFISQNFGWECGKRNYVQSNREFHCSI